MKKMFIVIIFSLFVETLFISCDNGTTSDANKSDDNKFLGLPYSSKFEGKDNFGGLLISYILECSYDEAFETITQQFGIWREQVGGQFCSDDYQNYTKANPNWVALQDCADFGQYRLLHKYNDDPNNFLDDGRAWPKLYEKLGTLKITGIPAQYDRLGVTFRLFDKLGFNFVVENFSTFYAIDKFYGLDTSYVNSGVADINLLWFPPPSTMYDRSGTYNHGQRFNIYFTFSSVSDFFYFPTISFTNGSAEVDFNTAKKIPPQSSW